MNDSIFLPCDNFGLGFGFLVFVFEFLCFGADGI